MDFIKWIPVYRLIANYIDSHSGHFISFCLKKFRYEGATLIGQDTAGYFNAMIVPI
jgi:hypothetical protein